MIEIRCFQRERMGGAVDNDQFHPQSFFFHSSLEVLRGGQGNDFVGCSVQEQDGREVAGELIEGGCGPVFSRLTSLRAEQICL